MIAENKLDKLCEILQSQLPKEYIINHLGSKFMVNKDNKKTLTFSVDINSLFEFIYGAEYDRSEYAIKLLTSEIKNLVENEYK
jgi:hypothetical protein